MNKKIFVLVFGILLIGIFSYILVLNDKPIGQFDNVKVIAVNGIINQSISNGEVSKKEVINESVEIVSKRTYNSKTFKNPSGAYTAQLFGTDIFFFDGSEFVELEKMSSPVLEKKIIPVSEKPVLNYFSFGKYLIYKGINISIENHELVLRDANGKKIKSLSRPFATDFNKDVSLGEYVIDFNKDSRVLSLGVEIDNAWLSKAVYPIEVDPIDITLLNNDTGHYSSHIAFIFPDSFIKLVNYYAGLGNVSDEDTEEIINTFAEFNTSIIDDSSDITNVYLNFSVEWINSSTDTVDRNIKVSITRFNNTQISDNSTYPTNSSGYKKLWYSIQNGTYVGGGDYLTNITDFQFHDTNKKDFFINLGSNAVNDFESQLDEDYFAMGFTSTNNSVNVRYEIWPFSICGFYLSLPDYTTSPYSGVEYVPMSLQVSYQDSCAPPEDDDWECNTTCILTDKNYLVYNDLFAYELCDLQFWGDTNITFDVHSAKIYVYPGAVISFYNTSKIFGY